MSKKYNKGFSLVELMIAIAVGSIVVGAIYQLFNTQQRVYLAQENVVEMQQNLRAGLYLLTTELRMAGFDPGETGNFGFVTDFSPPNDILDTDIDYAANNNIIAFTVDDNEDGLVQANDNEMIAYRFNDAEKSLERYRWVKDDGTAFRNWEAVATNVDALDFVYVDRSGNITINPVSIHAVELTILVRTKEKDNHYKNTQIYQNKRGVNICPACINDSYRRRLLSTTIRIRNL
jgi:prepilin-type N-terminal cleavage/methylation domain-containing protein